MRADWVECKLEEVVNVLDNLRKPINSKEREKRILGKKVEELYPYYGATGLVGYIDDYLTDGEFVLIGEDAAPFYNPTKGLAYKIKGKTWVNNHAHILKPLINDDFILYYLNQFNYKGYVSGTTRLKLTQGSLNIIPVKVAPLPEQRAIVKKIEALFSSLDSGTADLKKAQDQLKIYRQAVLKKAFEGEFEEVKLKEITTKIGSGSTPKGGNSNYKTSGIPLIRSLNIHFDYIKFKDLAFIDDDQAEKLKNVIVYENDVLLNITGASIGRVNLAPKEFDGGRVNQHVSIIRLKEDKAIPKFIKYYIQSSKVQDYINDENYGVTRQALTKGMIEDLLVPAITLEEQAQIVKEIEARLSVCDAVEQQIKDSLNQAEALRQSILKKAFEGRLLSEAEVNTCQQEPDYEPASVLLEKIKAEKETNKSSKKTTKGKPKKKMEKKEILQLLAENNNEMLVDQLWKNSVYSEDIDAFYLKLKELVETGKITEMKNGKKVSIKLI